MARLKVRPRQRDSGLTSVTRAQHVCPSFAVCRPCPLAFPPRLQGFKPLIDAGEVPQKNVDACRTYLELPHFNKVPPPASAAAADHQFLTCLRAVAPCVARWSPRTTPAELPPDPRLHAAPGRAAGNDEQQVQGGCRPVQLGHQHCALLRRLGHSGAKAQGAGSG
jgi:hypothetical protein